MEFSGLVEIAQVVSSIIMATDYFVPKSSIIVFETRVRKKMSWIKSMGFMYKDKCAVLGISLIVSCSLLSFFGGYFHVDSVEKIGHRSLLYTSLFSFAVFLSWFLFSKWLSFIVWCPKGVLAALTFPVFVVSTVMKISKVMT